MTVFDYAEMTRRNIGFVSESEQERLRGGRVFVCGTGGMGGACLQSLAHAGVGGFEIADFDRFELSNLNRQVFASLDALGRPKVEVTAERLRGINPLAEVRTHGADWLASLGEILARCRVVVNGMDDVAAGIQLYRAARTAGATVIDAYPSTLPSLMVAAPNAPRPEERLGYPTRGVEPDRFTPAMLAACRMAEIEYVLVHSSTAATLDPGIAAEIISGRRARISFAPMVLTTGNLMAYAAVAVLCGRPAPADARGWFMNPHSARIERPRPAPLAAFRRVMVRRFLASAG